MDKLGFKIKNTICPDFMRHSGNFIAVTAEITAKEILCLIALGRIKNFKRWMMNQGYTPRQILEVQSSTENPSVWLSQHLENAGIGGMRL